MTDTHVKEQFLAWIAARTIERREVLFRKSKNPIHAWRAYADARALRVQIPDWVLTYFDASAAALATEKHDSARAIANALGLWTRGGPVVTATAKTDERDLAIVERIFALQERPTHDDMIQLTDKLKKLGVRVNRPQKAELIDPGGRSLLEILTQVAEEYDLDVSQVQKIYYKFLPASLKRQITRP